MPSQRTGFAEADSAAIAKLNNITIEAIFMRPSDSSGRARSKPLSNLLQFAFGAASRESGQDGPVIGYKLDIARMLQLRPTQSISTSLFARIYP
ncbi:MAG: hypothetical protein EOP04_21320 [Proteobacteria bacterium]|nr:MAG: hypothetical protein EOP04_21320 [Pseudomonadota bacterium]